MSWLGFLLVLALTPTKQIILLDGTRMDVQNYKVREKVVHITMPDGSLHVLNRADVDVEATRRANREANARDALELYGVKDAAYALGSYAEAGIEAWKEQVSAQTYQRVSDEIRQGFDGEQLFDVIVDSFAEAIEDDLLDSWLHWLTSPLPQRMLELASRSQGEEAEQERPQFAERMKTDPPSADRVAIIERLDEAVQATVTALEVQVAMFEALDRGHRHLLPNAPPSPTPEQLRAAIQEDVKEATRMGLLFAYRTTSDEDLLSYISYWETDDGRRLTDAAKAGVVSGIRWAGARIESALEGVEAKD